MNKDELTEEKREMAEIIAVNYVIAQSDGFQLGYAQAISDFIQSIHDYWTTGDDQPQLSVLDTIAELGENLGNRKRIAKENMEKATEKGYTPDIQWSPIGGGQMVWLYTKHREKEAGGEENEDS